MIIVLAFKIKHLSTFMDYMDCKTCITTINPQLIIKYVHGMQ